MGLPEDVRREAVEAAQRRPGVYSPSGAGHEAGREAVEDLSARHSGSAGSGGPLFGEFLTQYIVCSA